MSESSEGVPVPNESQRDTLGEFKDGIAAASGDARTGSDLSKSIFKDMSSLAKLGLGEVKKRLENPTRPSQAGNAVHAAALCAADSNIEWLMWMTLQKGIKFFYTPLLPMKHVTYLGPEAIPSQIPGKPHHSKPDSRLKVNCSRETNKFEKSGFYVKFVTVPLKFPIFSIRCER